MTETKDNPYQPPQAGDLPEVTPLPEETAEFSAIARFGTRKFSVFAFEDCMQIRDDSGKLYEISRRPPLYAKLAHGLFIRRAIRVRLDKYVLLSFESDDYERLRSWIGPPTLDDLKEVVGGNSWWQLVVGLVFLLDGLGNVFSMVMGVSLLLSLILARVRPHRWLLLLHAVFFLMLAATNAHDVYLTVQAGQNPPIFESFLACLCLYCVFTFLRQFSEYGAVDMDETFQPPVGF